MPRRSALSFLLPLVFLLCACGESRRNDAPSPPPPTPTPATAGAQPPAAPSATATPAPSPPAQTTTPAGHDFIAEGRALLRVAACGDGEIPAEIDSGVVDAHCKGTRDAQERYRTRWITPARAFFAQHVPADIPRTVVYPFAGGDLSTALTVFPEADEITTISLEPAGDPRSLASLDRAHLRQALEVVQSELRFLYIVNFSNTLNLIDAMRGGKLPTQLVFSLSALRLHGFEPVSLRFFRIAPDGSLEYLDDDAAAAAGDPRKVAAAKRNAVFGNMELRFRRPGDDRVRVYRHIMTNLHNLPLSKDRRVLAHLERKGKVAGMTKAASYLLSWDEFSTMRTYLLDHVVWMVSDASGLPPEAAEGAGFTLETWGQYDGSHMAAGKRIGRQWLAVWKKQPSRPLPFRFGYPDVKKRNHLVISRRTS